MNQRITKAEFLDLYRRWGTERNLTVKQLVADAPISVRRFYTLKAAHERRLRKKTRIPTIDMGKAAEAALRAAQRKTNG